MEETAFFVEDKELGRIKLRSNSRAKRFVFRCTEEGLVCTLPVRARHSDLLRAIEQLRPRLKAMQERSAVRRANQQHFTPEQIESLRKQAKIELPPRLQSLAAARGLQYQKVSIHKSRTRWGSCSSKGNVSLSLYLMLLPPHLQDYVMQHELTHLVEMNHGPRFWALLDEATDGCSLRYRTELKRFSKSVF
ncbi:MAG: M48 family metallopeptidase [Bacteroidaceae bacterium]|nr:M48 family metallopeptidase [Bacteroidaceae bacterium]